MRIWLDDVRPMPEGFDVWCKNAFHCMALVATEPNEIEHISFDHDLGFDETQTEGYNQNNNGYYLAQAIESWVANNMSQPERFKIKPFTWDIHSANPVGRKNIEMAMKSTERFWNQNY